jgi:V/A-type H+/Na+-transporting ATPase subunit I
MSRRELGVPARMSRVAIVAPRSRLRETLVALADSGAVELAGHLSPPEGEEIEALRRLERRSPSTDARRRPRLAPETPDPAELEERGASALLAGEVELKRRAAAAVRHGAFAGYVGWTPEGELEELARRLAPAGAAVVEIAKPAWEEPPTLLRSGRPSRPFRPLVETYGSARYEDIDPTPFAAAAFVLMFGIMFGDVGHGVVLALLGLGLHLSGRLAGLEQAWPLVVACGVSGTFFGLLYGQFFGPTGVVPALWFDPLDEPVRLLVAALAVGSVLLAVSYALGTVNRWREHGAAAALVAPSGVAGSAVFLGGALALAGVLTDTTALSIAGAVTIGVGVLLLALGFFLEAGRGAAAVAQALVEVVDAVVRVGANAVSFARLAAFGLMHGALTAIVWDGTVALWSGALAILAVVLFLVGNAATFALEGLVAGVQALRLEYYELFSRIFAGEGRPFSPWSIPLATGEEES